MKVHILLRQESVALLLIATLLCSCGSPNIQPRTATNVSGTWEAALSYEWAGGKQLRKDRPTVLLTLKPDGSVGPDRADGRWIRFRDAMVVLRRSVGPHGAGVVECLFLRMHGRDKATGVFDAKGLDEAEWLGRGSATLQRVGHLSVKPTKSLTPERMRGDWAVTWNYTFLNSGENLSQWDGTMLVTLRDDGTVRLRPSGDMYGFWWSDGKALAVVTRWYHGNPGEPAPSLDKAKFYGASFAFMADVSETKASGTFEDRNLGGTGWWGRGKFTMERKPLR